MNAFGDVRSLVQREGGWTPARAREITHALTRWRDLDDLIERVWPYVMSHVPPGVVWRRAEHGVERVQGEPIVVVDLGRRELAAAQGRRAVFVRASGERSSWEHTSDVLAVAGGWGEWMSASANESKSWGAGPVSWVPLESSQTRRVESYGDWSWSARQGALIQERFEHRPECALRAGWRGRVEAGPMTLTHDFEPGTTSTIGRSVRCELCVRIPSVGKFHARLEVSRDPRHGIVGEVVDLLSTNGTYINGRRVARHSLRDHEIVTFASMALTLRRVMWSMR